jgi:hypothetical protein
MWIRKEDGEFMDIWWGAALRRELELVQAEVSSRAVEQ